MSILLRMLAGSRARALGLVGLGFFVGCADGVEEDRLHSWELYLSFHDSGPIEFHVDPGPAQVKARALAEALEEGSEFSGMILEEGDTQRSDRPRVVVGSFEEPDAARLALHLGVEPLPQEGGFRFNGRAYADPADALIAAFEDPERPGLPVVLFFGNDEELLAEYLTFLPTPWTPALELHAAGELAFVCPLEPAGRPLLDRAIDYHARRQAYWKESETLELDEGLTLRARKLPEGRGWRGFTTGLVRTRNQVTAWLAPPEQEATGEDAAQQDEGEEERDQDPGAAQIEEPSDPASVAVEILLYDHPSDVERLFGARTDLVINRFYPRVHAPWFPAKNSAANGLARVLARTLAGPPAHPWLLDGLAAAAENRWWGRPLELWAGHLQQGKLMPRLPEIVDARSAERISPHILEPARGFLFQFLITGPWKSRGNALWAGAPIANPKLAVGFAQRLQKAVLGLRKQRGGLRRPEILAAPFRRGVALVDDADGPFHTNYLTPEVGESLALAKELGADSYSLSVFAAPQKSGDRLVELDRQALHASASDVALITALDQGRRLEMRPMLVVHPLAGPSTTWADGLVMTSGEDIDQFFRSFEMMALHYALFCELTGVEILCLGTDLREATRAGPREGVSDSGLRKRKHKGWTRMLSKVRGGYGGALTYGAQFGDELAGIPFWDDLDYLGVCFYPRMAGRDVQPRRGVAERACEEAVERSIVLANRWNRPLLFVQAGFPARTLSWDRPAVPRGPYDPVEQQRFFELFADVLEEPRPDSEVLRGLFIWNWPVRAPVAVDREQLRGAGDFTPRGRVAEEALTRVLSER